MKVNELKEDTYIKEWLEALNATDNTERNYLQGMQFFTECVKKTPEELILEAEAEIETGVIPRKRKIKQYFIGFRKDLQDKALAPMTVRTHLTGVKSFYKNFDIEIPSLPKAGNKATTLERNKAIPNKDDLYAVLKVCDPLERAILLLGASSGLSCEDIINLKVSNFKGGYESKTEITTMPLRRIKTKVDFVTFLSPELSPDSSLFTCFIYFATTALTLCFSLSFNLSLIHISEPTRRTPISYAVFCLKK